MDLLILNTEYSAVSIIDSYESFIWTDRYNGFGDFELYIPASMEAIMTYIKGYYIVSKNSEHVMIIEDIELKSDSEDGNRMYVTGRSLESILDRRIVWTQTIIRGKLQLAIKKLIMDSIITPVISERKIINFIFKDSQDPYILNLSLDDEMQFTGDNLYDVIKSLCDRYDLGFKITLNDENQFVFELYKGMNRAYDQETNPYVIFSPNFDNIINSNYLESIKTFKNVTLIAGEGEGINRITTVVGSEQGINRRELYTDARDISKTTEKRILTDEEYIKQLTQRGSLRLKENKEIRSFDGQVEANIMFKYHRDFFLGDIVQLENEYGLGYKARVTEFIYSKNSSELKTYPSFEIIES